MTVIWHGIPAEPLELEPLAESSLREPIEGSQDGKLIIAEDSGHYITFDRPDMVIAEISAMLRQMRREGRSYLPTVAKARLP